VWGGNPACRCRGSRDRAAGIARPPLVRRAGRRRFPPCTGTVERGSGAVRRDPGGTVPGRSLGHRRRRPGGQRYGTGDRPVAGAAVGGPWPVRDPGGDRSPAGGDPPPSRTRGRGGRQVAAAAAVPATGTRARCRGADGPPPRRTGFPYGIPERDPGRTGGTGRTGYQAVRDTGPDGLNGPNGPDQSNEPDRPNGPDQPNGPSQAGWTSRTGRTGRPYGPRDRPITRPGGQTRDLPDSTTTP
jgi:hypothetical protein